MVFPTVKDGISASDGSYDLVLCDYDLDDAKGSEFVEEFRARGYTTPIIAVSAHDEGNQKMLSSGADAACKKLEFRQLNSTIDTLLK